MGNRLRGTACVGLGPAPMGNTATPCGGVGWQSNADGEQSVCGTRASVSVQTHERIKNKGFS